MIRNDVIHMQGLVLPETSRFRRQHLLPEAERTEGYLKKYDRRTLIYDCVHLPENGTVLFTAPRFLNLWPLFRDNLRESGHPVRWLKRQVFPKFELLRVRWSGGRLSFDLDGVDFPITPRQPLASRFAGMNAVVTMNRNNRLEWIADWLRFHVRAHGLEAALIHDNGSDTYTPQDLAACMGAVDGIKAAVVLVCDYPYGLALPKGTAPVTPKFLQSAMMNLARVETLSRARAVLNADIDEFIIPTGARGVFDAAARQKYFPIKIAGSYVFPERLDPAGVAQSAHHWRADPPQRSNGKWCATPNGLFSKIGWYVHQTGGELYKLLRATPDFHLAHCAATRSNPKPLPDARRHDPALASIMERYLGAGKPDS